MNLSKRSVFVIVPVIFLSYILAGLFAYYPFRSTIRNLEQNRLDLAVTELASSFNQYSTYADSYLLTLSENKTLRRFISSGADGQQKILLAASIEKAIRKIELYQSDKISLLITKKQATSIKELFFFELSTDPFAKTDQSLINAYQTHYQNNLLKSWYYNDNEDHSLIVVSKLLDQATFNQPIANQLANSVLVQVAVEPTGFIERKNELIKANNAHIDISSFDKKQLEQNNLNTNKLISARRIGRDKMITVSLAPNFLTNKLLFSKLIFGLISLCLFLISSILLYQLVRKYITQPISDLEHELADVLSNQRPNITLKHNREDEIGKLEKTFHQLYGQLSDSYIKTKKLAEHDSLTLLHNLTFISAKSQLALTEAEKSDLGVSFMYIDLDNFKFVNDKYGHDVGDALLKAFAGRLTQILNSNDLTSSREKFEITHGRIAGDEFSVIISHPRNSVIAEKIARRILNIFHQGFNFELGKFPVSASIGISVYPEDGHTLTQLVSNADSAMYQAKNNGKNGYSFYSKELAMAVRRKIEIEQELKTLDPDKEFFLVYMPLIEAKTKKIAGFEVLIRWKSPKLGFVGPDEFVPIAESCGLFNKIDAWVAENAISAYHDLKNRLGYDYKLSINLSSAQLNFNSIANLLIQLTEKYQVAPKFIQLEITETLNVEYTKKADALLNILCQSGFQIAIDDFGTGNTALLQLIEYPSKMIKFDKTFVEKAMLPTNRMMLSPLVLLCHSQGLKVTVEGVETAEMEDYLTSIGCDYLQGFYYGKPARLNELTFPIA